MKPLQKLIVVAILAAAIGVVVARRNQQRTQPHAVSPTPAPQQTTLPRLVDLGAGKCIPCKAMAPILEALRTDYAAHFEVVFIDVWENPDAARPYELNLIPTQIFFDAAGHELWRHEGFLARDDILAKWRELGVDI